MSSPADSGFPPDDDPLSKAAFDAALAQHDAAIGSTAAELDAEIARLSRGSDILVHPAARPSQPAMAKSGTARIAAYLGVKDEAELIEVTIAHLRAIGVDHIVACDMGSTDGTWELLERYRSKDDFWLVQLDDHEPGYFENWDRTVADQVKQTGADWAIFLDADEYWIPASGSLKACAALGTADILSVPRFNVPLAAAGPAMPDRLVPGRYDELLLLVKPIPNFHVYLKENPESPWIEGVPDRKPMARPHRIAGFAIWGAHDIVVAGEEPVRRASPADLLIAHVPFTTRSRFTRKVENIRRIFAVHDSRFGQDSAWHWRRWLELADQGRLDEEFERTVFGGETLRELRLAGVVQSAAEVFAASGCPGQDRIPAYSPNTLLTSAAVAKSDAVGEVPPPELAKIFVKWRTDKAQSVNHRKHVEAYGYAGLYECLFRRYRSEVTAVLEIGIGSLVPTAESSMVGHALPGYRPGGSLRAWREYFENATIFGLDVQRDTQFDNEHRIVTRLCYSTDEIKVREIMREEGFPEFFDIIIDDGSHAALDQMATLRNFFPYLKANGVYVIEDIEDNGFLDGIEQVKEICGDSPFFFLGPANTAFVLMKRG